MSIRFYYHLLRRDVTNFSFLRHVKLDGFIVTMHQAGTHWLKHMLACAITRELGLSPPQYAYAGDIIGGAKRPIKYPGLPAIGHSHTIPSPLMGSKILRKFYRLPRYVVLVRDIRAILVSNYEKHKPEYLKPENNYEFSEYLRGDVTSQRFYSDIWWAIRFQNAWGKIIAKYPDEIIVIKYEDMVTDSLAQLQAINTFLKLNLSTESLLHGVQESTKEKMSLKPGSPKKVKKSNVVVVRMDTKPGRPVFAKEDELFFKQTCRTYLKYDFGYDYS